MRSSSLLLRAVLLLALGTGPAALGAPRKRPAVDRSAIREALAATAREPSRYSSPASYAHFLRSRLLHQAGQHRESVDELRLALATDQGNPLLITRLAEEYLRLGDIARAERELRRIVEEQPEYFPARLLFGRVLLESGRASRARLHLRRAIQLRPTAPEPYLALAQLYLEAGAPAQAVKVIEEQAAALPGEASGYRRLGLALAERGDSARAEALLSRAVERDRGDIESWLTLAQLQEQAGRLEQAEQSLATALERDPDNPHVLFRAGQLCLQLEHPSRARAWFDRLLSLSEDPDVAMKVAMAWLAARDTESALQVLDQVRRGREPSARASFYAGLLHERLRRYRAAAEAYAEVPASSEMYADARSRRAACLSQAGDHAAALSLLQAALAEQPEDVGLRVLQARALERSGAPLRAESTLREALSRTSAPELYEALASTLRRQGRPEEALSLLSSAAERHPADTSLLYALGAALHAQGQVPRALASMRAVLALDPEHAAALNFIGYTLAQRGESLTEAERLVQRALALRPDTAAFLDSLGLIHYKRGEAARAVEVLERAAALDPQEPTILEHLGDAYRKLSRLPEATRSYRQALDSLEQDPEAAESPQQRALLERKLKMLLSTGKPGR